MTKLEQLIKELCPNGVEYKKLGDIATDVFRGAGITRDQVTEEGTPCVRYGEIYTTYGIYFDTCVSHTDESTIQSKKYFEHGDILFAITGESVEDIAKSTAYVGYEKCLAGGDIVVLKHKQNPKYLSYVLSTTSAQAQKSKGKVKSKVVHSSVPAIKDIVIPVPPVEVQAEIVKILDEYSTSVTALQQELEKELTARKKQYEYYRDLLLDFGVHGGETSECEWRTMGSLFKIEMCRRVKKEETTPHGEIPFYQNGTLGKEAKLFLTRETYEKYKAISKMPQKGSVMLSTAGTLGRAFEYNGEEAYYQDSNIIWLNNDESVITNAFLLTYCRSFPWKVPTRGTLKHLHNYMIEDTLIPIPPIEEQERIVSILDRFDKLCNDISEGLPAEIEARRKQYEYYRDKLLTFAPN